MNHEPYPLTQQPDPTALDRLRLATAEARIRLGRIVAVGLLAAASTLAAFTAEEVTKPTPAMAYDVTTGDYPWWDAAHVPKPPAGDDITWGYTDKAMCDNKSAAYDCDTYKEGSYYVYDQWKYYLRNCTSYVAWRLAAEFGANASGLGNAKLWDDNASSKGWTVKTTPEVGDIAQWDSGGGGFGHVSFVAEVNADGTVNTDEYNGNYDGNFGHSSHVRAEHYIDVNGPNPAGFKLKIGNDSNKETPPGTRLVGDLNGDGKADALVMYRDTGNAYAGISDGHGFAAAPGGTPWAAGHTKGADKYFLGDVNGDGKDDLVAFWSGPGQWIASFSDGTGFQREHPMAMGQGIGTSKQFIADVNGDRKADMVTVDANTGDWYASLSDGNGFQGPPQLWRHGHGAGSSDQFVADFNGDGRADAAVYFANNGNWYVGLSNGVNGFGYPNQWSVGYGMNSSKRFVGDVNGDHMADEASFFLDAGVFDNAMSSGGGFWTPGRWATGQGQGTADQFLADTTGDGKADLITFDRSTGNWNVSNSLGTSFGAPVLWLVGMGKGS